MVLKIESVRGSVLLLEQICVGGVVGSRGVVRGQGLYVPLGGGGQIGRLSRGAILS